MRDRYFNTKLLNLVLIILLLAGYQTVIYTQAQKEKIQKLEYQLTAESAGASSEITEKAAPAYIDGTYTGEAQGFGGLIKVSVKVKEGEIDSVEILEAKDEDSAYLETAKGVIDQIVKEQSTQVDTVSGATFSSGGIRDAVTEALKGAVEE